MKNIQYIILILILFTTSNVISQTVYTTKKGKKKEYHKVDCKSLKEKKEEIKIFRAISLGYTACEICKPTSKNAEKTTPIDHAISKKSKRKKTKKHRSSTSTKKSSSVRCSGRTRKGSRCKRKTRSSSGRCYQH